MVEMDLQYVCFVRGSLINKEKEIKKMITKLNKTIFKILQKQIRYYYVPYLKILQITCL